MPDTHDGTILFNDELDDVAVHFERSLPYPRETVWKRLVDRAHLHEWIAYEPGSYIQHKAGGEVFLHTVGGAIIDTLVSEYNREASLVFPWETMDWDGGDVVWALEPTEGGTLLMFEHADEDHGPEHFLRLLANWHVTLDRFEASLAGKPEPWSFEAWEAHYRRYERRISVGQ